MSGVNLTPSDSSAILSVAIISATATSTAAVAAVTGQQVRVYKMVLVAATATTLTITDATGGSSLSGAIPLAANGSMVLDMDGLPWFTTSQGNALVLANSVPATITGAIWYTQNPIRG